MKIRKRFGIVKEFKSKLGEVGFKFKKYFKDHGVFNRQI